MKPRLLMASCIMLLIPALTPAQSSANYTISDHVFNNGGGPSGTMVPTSVGFKIPLDSIGNGVGVTQMTSLGFQMQGSFVFTYRPPGEVLGLQFTNKTTLVWEPEPSVGTYDLYRSEIPLLPGGDTGVCLASQIPETIIYEPFDPDPGHAWFYLVTARNRLREQGTKGYRSNGTERPNPGPCF